MISFGTGSYFLKSWKASEFNIQGWDGITIELRQKYFNLFYVPMFPIGKAWIFRKPSDKNMYVLPADLQAHILRQNPQIPVSYMAFIGPMIILFLLLVFIVSTAVSSSRKAASDTEYAENAKKDRIKKFNEALAAQDLLIDRPGKRDFYTLRDTDNNYLFAKVVASTADSVKLIAAYDSIHEIQSVKRAMTQKLNDAQNLKPVTISKKSLKSALCRDFGKQGRFNGAAIAELNNGYYSLNVSRINGPDIVAKGTGGYGGGDIYLYFINEGYAGKIKAVNTISGNILWDSYQKEIDSGEFDLRGKQKQAGPVSVYKFEIICSTDSINEDICFVVEGVQLAYTIKRDYTKEKN